MTFLQEGVQIWERSAKTQVAVPRTDNFQKRRDNQSKSTQRVRANPVNQQTHKTSGFKCPVCGAREFHYISKCPAFLKKSVSERRQHLKETNSCYNCLSPNHRVGECKSKGTCRECHERHHTLLHVENRKSTPAAKVQDEESDEKEDNSGSARPLVRPPYWLPKPRRSSSARSRFPASTPTVGSRCCVLCSTQGPRSISSPPTPLKSLVSTSKSRLWRSSVWVGTFATRSGSCGLLHTAARPEAV